MKTSFLYLIFALLLIYIFSSCKHDSASPQLTHVQKLLDKQLPDSAMKVLMQIQSTIPSNGENKAFYNLLYTRTLYQLHEKEVQDSIIDYSISYYEHIKDDVLLGMAYYYKGMFKLEKKRYNGICI